MKYTKNKQVNRKITKYLLAIGLTIVVLVGFSQADNGDSQPFYTDDIISLDDIIADMSPILDSQGRQAVNLTLADTIARALQYNLDIQVSRLNPSIRMADITVAEAAFDAVLFGSSQWNCDERANMDATYYERVTTSNGHTRVEKIPVDRYSKVRNDQYSVGISKFLPTGATVEIAQRLRRYRDLKDGGYKYFDPFWEYSFETQLRQPLLRDYGVDINRAQIEINKNVFRISKQQFQQQIIDTVSNVETNYWRLFMVRQQVKILEHLVVRSEQSLARALQRDDYDGKSLSVSRIRGVLEQAKSDLIAAKNSVQKQQEVILALLNDPSLPINSRWELITVDVPMKREFKPDAIGATEIALRVRPELISQQIQVQSSQIIKDVADNQRLPRLDMVMQTRTSGADRQYSDAWSNQWQADSSSYTLGVSIELPIANRAARAGYLKSQRQLQQARMTLKNVQEQIIADVNIAAHNVGYVFEELAGRISKAETDKDEYLSYMVVQQTEARGALTPDFVDRQLNADQRMTSSQMAVVQAMVSYDLAIMNYYRAQGTLLRYNNIKVGEQE